MSQIISNEVPSWTIDGVNKSFSTANTILSVVSLSVDGAEYYWFTFDSQTLTLTDAPTLSIRVDYIATWTNANPALNIVTLTDLLDATYKVLWESSSNTNYNSDTVTEKINSIVDDVCKWLYIHPQTQQRYTAGDLSFLRRDHFIQCVKPLALGNAITTSSTEIDLTTSSYASSGSVLVWNDIIDYSSKSATHLTSVTGVWISHNAGEKAYQLYSLPSNISLPFTVFRLNSSGNIQYEIPYADYRYPVVESVYYTILTKSDWTNLLHIVGCSDARVKLVYYANSTDMTTDASTCSIPDDFSIKIIPNLVAGEILRENEEIEDAISKINKGCAKLDAMYSYYSKMTRRNRERIRVQTNDFNWLWFNYGYRRNNRRTR